MAGDELDVEVKYNVSAINLVKFRKLVRCYLDRHQYESALFWADKIVSLSQGDALDLFWYAQTLFLTGQYHRAVNIIKFHNLDKKYLSCRYLKARCYFASKDYQESLDILDQVDNTDVKTPTHCNSQHDLSALGVSSKLESSINLLRGKVYEEMDNRNLAAECFREALKLDVFCYEAFHGLINHHMLSSQEEQELIDSLPFEQQCTEEEIELIRFLYESQLKKYHKPSSLTVPPLLDRLDENLDVMVCLAERQYYNCDFRSAFQLTSAALSKDLFNHQCLPIHIATLVELKKSNELFSFAHKLVEIYPKSALSWFAIGCYYLLIGKNDPARRYFGKATTLDRVFGPAWLAYGHSFAVENEHDQAMATYFTSAQLMKGCHLPVLYIGLEYGLTNNTKLAERFFSQALSIAPNDPFVLHEMAVIAFQSKDWDLAEKYFLMALQQVEQVCSHGVVDMWEPLLCNLGHTCRKLRKYDEALDYHEKALVLCPKNPSTLSAIGYVHTLKGNSAQAVDYFHKALSFRRDDSFATTMLGHAIEQLISDQSPCDGVPDTLPSYTYDQKLMRSDVKSESPVTLDKSIGFDSTMPDDDTIAVDTSTELSAIMDKSGMIVDSDVEEMD